MKKLLCRIMPLYAWILLILLLSANFLVYFCTRFFTAGWKHYSLKTPLDRALPFVPFFVFFYVLAYLQWVIGYVMIGRGGRETAFRILVGELIAKGITLVFFIFLPTTVESLRPAAQSLQDGGLWCRLTALIYRLDAADNCFPSVHCLESWVCFRGALRLKNVPKWYAPVMLATTLLVFASTVLVRQHVLADILGGVLAAQAGLFLADRLKPERFAGEEGGA